MIQVAVPARRLKLGDRALTGHVSFFDRTSNITDVANVLPRLAADVKVMEFTVQVGRGVNHTYRGRVRRYKVEGALRWLCANSPAYIGVTISNDNLALLPRDGQLEVTVIQVTEEPNDDEDKGPAEEQRVPGEAPAATTNPSHGYDPLSVRRDARQVGAEGTVLQDGQDVPRLARVTAIVGGVANAGPLVQVEYLDDNSIGDSISLENVFIDVETEHTGVVDAGDAQPHNAARDAQAGLTDLAQAAQFPTAAAARAAQPATAAPTPSAPRFFGNQTKALPGISF